MAAAARAASSVAAQASTAPALSRGYAMIFGKFSQFRTPRDGWDRHEEAVRRQEAGGRSSSRRQEDDVGADEGANVSMEIAPYNYVQDVKRLHKHQHILMPGRVAGGISQRDYSEKKPVFMRGARRNKLKAENLRFRRFIERYNAMFEKGAVARKAALEQRKARREGARGERVKDFVFAWSPKIAK
uniref:Uncharacterized protein n=1 Tax=Prasinoderma coloniale TaxID=156133 RepID=A0A7R9TKF2_9VIRI